jgi:hypothetical protein
MHGAGTRFDLGDRVPFQEMDAPVSTKALSQQAVQLTRVWCNQDDALRDLHQLRDPSEGTCGRIDDGNLASSGKVRMCGD